MENRPRITVAAVIEREGRFLLVEERDGNDTVLNQPAGHMESGESLLEAVTRETWEETAWRFQPTALVGIYQWASPNNGMTYLRFCFSGECGEHDPEQPLDGDIIRTWWLRREELLERSSQHRSPLVMRCIDDYRAGKRYSLSMYADVPVS